MAESYTYHVDVYRDGGWRNHLVREDQTVDERSAEEIARAVLEDWIIDHPAECAGGGRVVTYGPDDFDNIQDEPATARVVVFRGPASARDAVPTAAAYLLADPDARDPHTWVNL